MEINIKNEKKKFNEYLLSTNRDNIENLLKHLEIIGFYEAPASSKYHLSEKFGLLIHSNSVLDFTLQNLKNIISDNKINIDSVIISCLLHDIGKCGAFGKPLYIPDNDKFKTNKELSYIPHEIISLKIISRFIYLTEEETFAIVYHNGLYSPLGSEYKGKEQPLQQLLHFADMWSSRFIENNLKIQN